MARDMCELNHSPWNGPNLTVHLFGEGDTEQATQHAWRLLSMTSFKPGEAYAGVRWATDVENEDFEVRRIGMVIVKKAAATAIPTGAAAGVIIQENKEHNGIELKFPGKPSEVILAQLKNNGWRWNRTSMVWYNRRSAESKEFAEKIARQVA